jgi:DNA-binding transcriptional LysR family regulator
MELYQLRTFAAVAEFGSLTQAAERLHLSQPAASAQIKLLEEEFGIALFERKPSGLTLTRAGADLLPGVQTLLTNATQVVIHAKSLRGRVTGSIKFATLATLSDTSLLRIGAMMKSIVTQHPHLDIEVQHRNSRSIVAGVASGELDAGMALDSGEIANISRIRLKELQYRIVAPASWHPSIRHARLEELASKCWISTPKGGSHHQMTAQLFKQLGCEPKAVIEADSEPVITGLVRAGLGLGLMREDLALAAENSPDKLENLTLAGESAPNGIIVLENGRPSTFLQVLYRSGRESDPAICAILDVLLELWKDDLSVVKHAAKAARKAPKRPPSRQPEVIDGVEGQPGPDGVGARQAPQQLPRMRGQLPTV